MALRFHAFLSTYIDHAISFAALASNFRAKTSRACDVMGVDGEDYHKRRKRIKRAAYKPGSASRIKPA